MLRCLNCGEENPQRARFCLSCGTALAESLMAPEQRRTVTVLFSDVVGSTSLGEAIDPEALRALLARFFEQMKQIVERHGGTVEKFIGDAVMAVFGVPVAREDDALRACRAAMEMRDAFPGLGIDGRIGLTTGEVVTGTRERLATGDAVNVAARLQQAAQPQEVLIGAPTLALVAGAVQAEPMAPLALKGKAQPVVASRLIAVHEAPARSHEVRFVGREQELGAIERAWQRVLTERRCELLTIVGEAGVGKSRLVAEAIPSLQAPVVQGRCLPYGDGITYWPVVEVIKQIDARSSDPTAAAAIQSVLGVSAAATSAEEIAWAFRKLIEEAAPLVVVFDDIQWGEDVFLDLLEHVRLLSDGFPLLLVCMARPELSERRPQWPLTLMLEPLADKEIEALVGQRLPAEIRARIARAAGGNPLFVGEMLAMVGDANGDVMVPPTLRALLAARLDQLAPADRRVLESAAVEGEVFHRGVIQALAQGESAVTARLVTLVRKELIRPDRAQLPGEDGFRFRHLLVRDAAYEGLAKSVRSELHERLGRWLQRRGEQVNLPELDEIIGYHLEQAILYRIELGLAARTDPLAGEAAEYLAVAARRAGARRDVTAAAQLLRRARGLVSEGSATHRRYGLSLASALATGGDFANATTLLADVEAAAAAADDAPGAAHARLDLITIRSNVDPEGAAESGRAAGEAAMPLFEAAKDELGLAKAWRALAMLDDMHARFAPVCESLERALEHLRKSGDAVALSDMLAELAHAVTMGPTVIPDALARLRSILAEVPDDRALRAHVQVRAGFLLAQAGNAPAALAAEAEAEEILLDLGLEYQLARFGLLAGDLERFLGRLERAEEVQRRADAIYERVGERSARSTLLALLGRTLIAQGRPDEAEAAARLALELGSSDDLATLMQALAVLARTHAERGESASVETSSQAVAFAEQTDMLGVQGEIWENHGHVLCLLGRPEEAQEALQEAVYRYKRKGATALAERVRAHG